MARVNTCGHLELPYYCRDKCRSCYNRWRYANVPGAKTKHRAACSAWEKKNPEKTREKAWRRHGIDIQWSIYREMVAAQGGACMICKKVPLDGPLVVDHDHTTRAVRGLLCRNCNYYLGWFEANSDAALGYLSIALTAAQ